MTRRVSSGAPWEPVVGYSRAVAAGDHVFVTGSVSIIDGEVAHEGDVAAQTDQAITVIETALAELGVTLADVVRTRIYVTDISQWEAVGRVHGARFGDAMPATTMVQVAALIDPRCLVEIEAVAYKPGVGFA